MKNLKTQDEIISNWNKNIETPTVSICCITYNHENFISQAIDGFLIQKTNFPFEIIIRDDCSTDKTASTIKEYVKKYPKIIKPIFEKENTFSKGMRPLPQTLKKAIGKYIAICEGDDYWIDENKIQKQVDFLEENKEYILSCTNILSAEQKNNFIPNKTSSILRHNKDFEFSIEEVIIGKAYIKTLTVVFRNVIDDPSKIPYRGYWAGDHQLWMYLMQFGKGYYHSYISSVYRRHSGGVSYKFFNPSYKRKIEYINGKIKNNNFWNKFYNFKYNQIFLKLEKRYNYSLFLLYLKTLDFINAIKIANKVEVQQVKNKKLIIPLYVFKILFKIKEKV